MPSKTVIFNRRSYLTFFGDSASIPEKKQPVPSTRGMDGTGWKKGWFQSAMPGGSACTLRTMVPIETMMKGAPPLSV